jgi:hypothetical protein
MGRGFCSASITRRVTRAVRVRASHPPGSDRPSYRAVRRCPVRHAGLAVRAPHPGRLGTRPPVSSASLVRLVVTRTYPQQVFTESKRAGSRISTPIPDRNPRASAMPSRPDSVRDGRGIGHGGAEVGLSIMVRAAGHCPLWSVRGRAGARSGEADGCRHRGRCAIPPAASRSVHHPAPARLSRSGHPCARPCCIRAGVARPLPRIDT